MVTCTLRQDGPSVWMNSFLASYSNDVITLCGDNNSQVEVSSVVMLAASPLTRIILSDHLPPPAYSPVYLTIPSATHQVLLAVRDILFSGTVAGLDVEKVEEVRRILKMLMIEASLVCCHSMTIDVSCMFVKDLVVKEEAIDSSDDMFENSNVEEGDKVCVAESDQLESQVFSRRVVDQVCEQKDAVTRIETTRNVKRCFVWSISFSHPSDLDRHIKNKHLHGENSIKCYECCKRFSKKSILKRHIESVHMKITYSCHLCTRKYTQQSSLRKHIRVIHLKRYFKCEVCDEVYRSHSKFTRHIMTGHEKISGNNDLTVVKPQKEMYKCPTVENRFEGENLDSGLDDLNERSKQFTCDSCDYKTNHKGSLKMHIEGVHMKITHSCNLCTQKYTLRSNLLRHLRKGHKEG